MKVKCGHCKKQIVPDPDGVPGHRMTLGGGLIPEVGWVHYETVEHLCEDGGCGALPPNELRVRRISQLPSEVETLPPNIETYGHRPELVWFRKMFSDLTKIIDTGRPIIKMDEDGFDEEFQEEYE